MRSSISTTFLVLAATAVLGRAQEAVISVQGDHVLHRVTTYLTGACLEDVNHEVYGGIDSQMIFGESFAEPMTPSLATWHYGVPGEHPTWKFPAYSFTVIRM